jgi:lysophospholipase L1-like esterase
MPMYNPTPKKLSRLFPAVLIAPLPVMDNPPITTLARGVGLSSASIVSGGDGYAVGDNLTPVGGESDFTGRLRVTAVDDDGVITAAAVQTAGVYSVQPGNPVEVTGGDGTGAQFNLGWNASTASSIYNPKLFSRTDADAFEFLGYSPKDITSGYRGNGVQNGTQAIIEFYSDADYLEYRFSGGNYQGDVYVNGQRIAAKAVKTDTSGASYVYVIDWNGSSEIRHYRLCGINTGFGGVNAAQPFSIWKPTGMRKLLAWQEGDSYTVGIGATQGSFNVFRVMCDCLGIEGIADGISGAGWTSIQDGRVPPQRIELKLGSITRAPDLVFFSMGYNDAAVGRTEQLKENIRLSYKRVRELCPAAIVINIGPATPLGRVGIITTIRQAEIEVCEELNIPFIDVDNWVSAANKSMYTGGDGVHPTDAGHAYLGVRIAQAVSEII